MTNSIEKEPMSEQRESKKEQELNTLFDELLNKAKQKLEQVKQEDKKYPESIGERLDWEYYLDWQFFEAWDEKFPFNVALFAKNDKRREVKTKQILLFRQALPTLYQEAIENYQKFVKEDRWKTAEDWEMSEEDQFTHLIEEEVRKNFEKRLNDLEKED